MLNNRWISPLYRKQPSLAGRQGSPFSPDSSKCKHPATVLLAISLLALPGALQAGLVQTTDNQKFEGSVYFGENGAVVIESTNRHRQSVTMDKVRVAQFGLVGAENVLPKGWFIENIGQVQGSTVLKEGRFAMRVTGGMVVKDPKSYQAVHLACRPLRADGEVVARLESVSGKSPAVAGVMMRQNNEAPGGFILLGVSPDQKLHFQARQSGWQSTDKKDLGPVSLPLWLKLVRQEKTVTAYRSADGKTWQKLEQHGFEPLTEPFPEGSGAWKPRILAGLAITGPGTNALAQSTFDQASITVRGLLGAYYADKRFESLRFTRPDQEFKYHWRSQSPGLDIVPREFSARWTGKLEPKVSATYRIFCEAEGSAKLWLNGTELTRLCSTEGKEKKKGHEIQLEAGRKYDMKLEYVASDGQPHMQLIWNAKGVSGEDIPANQLSYTYTVDSPDEYGEATRTNIAVAKGIWLRNGGFIAGEIRAADDTATRVVFCKTNELLILNSRIARVHFHRLYRPLPFQEIGTRTGLLLKSGEFFESDFRGVKDRFMTVSSVLFGQRRYGLQGGEVTALVLNNNSLPAPARFEVRLLDGSVLRADSVRGTQTSVLIHDTSLGEITLRPGDVLHLKRVESAPGLRAASAN